MKIQKSLYKKLELNSVEKELEIKFNLLPAPMCKSTRGCVKVDSLREMYSTAIEACETTINNKCTFEDLCSVGQVYDKSSLEVLQFLADNIDKVRLADKKYTSTFNIVAVYEGRTHKLEILCRSESTEQWCADDKFLRAYVLESEFIPLVIKNIGGPENLDEAEEFPWLYKDMINNKEVVELLEDWLEKLEAKPSLLKYYNLMRTASYGYILKATGVSINSEILNDFVTEDSVKWGDIKKSCFLIAGLNAYLKDLDYPPRDDIWYFIKVSKKTGDLWLRRDMGNSPKALKNYK